MPKFEIFRKYFDLDGVAIYFASSSLQPSSKSSTKMAASFTGIKRVEQRKVQNSDVSAKRTCQIPLSIKATHYQSIPYDKLLLLFIARDFLTNNYPTYPTIEIESSCATLWSILTSQTLAKKTASSSTIPRLKPFVHSLLPLLHHQTSVSFSTSPHTHCTQKVEGKLSSALPTRTRSISSELRSIWKTFASLSPRV